MSDDTTISDVMRELARRRWQHLAPQERRAQTLAASAASAAIPVEQRRERARRAWQTRRARAQERGNAATPVADLQHPEKPK